MFNRRPHDADLPVWIRPPVGLRLMRLVDAFPWQRRLALFKHALWLLGNVTLTLAEDSCRRFVTCFTVCLCRLLTSRQLGGAVALNLRPIGRGFNSHRDKAA